MKNKHEKSFYNSRIMVIDIELTLNRFGLGKIAENKFQLFWLRFSKWQIPNKHSISFEINWKTKDKGEKVKNKE
ncbi:MAG: hypothetical protein AAB861_02775 [Patescibacteria group bacterium]